MGDTSHEVSRLKDAGGVRGYGVMSSSLNAVSFSAEITSIAEMSGAAEITRAAMPATSGVALEVPPKLCRIASISSPRAVVTRRPSTVRRR